MNLFLLIFLSLSFSYIESSVVLENNEGCLRKNCSECFQESYIFCKGENYCCQNITVSNCTSPVYNEVDCNEESHGPNETETDEVNSSFTRTASSSRTTIFNVEAIGETGNITVSPTSIPSGRHFDAPSFIGGIVLALGLLAIIYVSFKFYKARTERNYHTL